MKVLLDECARGALRRTIQSGVHTCTTAQDAGWAGKKNGELLDLAEGEFDVFATIDTNLYFQQNLKGRRIAVVVLAGASNRLVDLKPLFPACIAVLDKMKRGDFAPIRKPHG